MPKPLPDYIPGEIRDQIAMHGYTGVAEYSEHLGLKRARLLDVFGSENVKLRPYKDFAKYAGISLDRLAGMMLSGELGKYITELSAREGVSIRRLEQLANVGEGFLQKKIRTGIYTNGLRTYIEVAQALGWSLDKLADNCLK